MRLVRSCVAVAATVFVCTGSGTAGLYSLQPAALAVVGSHTRIPEDNSRSTDEDSGALNIIDANGRQLGRCPLKHTSIDARISGYVSRVTVEQTFTNPYSNTIEAVYTFPLADSGAVDEMNMRIGARTIRGVIKTREEARTTYENAKRQGVTASLLDQERANIFTQSVANIPPHETVKIEIKYTEYLTFESGNYTFAFPMVVGPRYMPGIPRGNSGTGSASDTDRVPDASKISPPLVSEHSRSGHDVSLHVFLDAGMPIQGIESKLHKVDINKPASGVADITLAQSDSIPNRDFVLTWKVATDAIHPGYLTHKDGDMGFFSVMLLPPARVTPGQICPREINFVVDRSGSQEGLPLQKARETMLYILDRLNPNDTFQVLSFSSRTERLFDHPLQATPQNIADAKRYVASLDANGGTEMREAIEQATSAPEPNHRLRMFVLMTDGYIGNDQEVIGLVKRTRGQSRWFTFGTGNSVNRLLIDGIAKAGGGEADYVLLNSPGNEVAKKFFDKISSPVLTDVKVDFKGLDVADIQPLRFDDLWAQRPIYVTGKYCSPGSGSVTISGYSAGKPYSTSLPLTLPAKETTNAVLPGAWARARIEELMQTVYEEDPSTYVVRTPLFAEAKELIEKLGLFYHLLTNFTSLVAVDDSAQRFTPSTHTLTVASEAPDGVVLNRTIGTSKLLPEEIGRVEGPKDTNLFQVEPTVLDERHYTSGRDERHQKTGREAWSGAQIGAGVGTPSTLLRKGSPVVNYNLNNPTSGVRSGAPAALGTNLGQLGAQSGGRKHKGSIGAAPILPEGTPPPDKGDKAQIADASTTSKVTLELEQRLNRTSEGNRLVLKLTMSSIDNPAIAKLKALGSLEIMKTQSEKKELTICVPANLVRKIADMKEVLRISSAM